MPDISLNAIDGSQFSSTTIASQSTNKNKDNSVHFQTILDGSDKIASVSDSGKDKNPSMATLNQIFQKAADKYGVDVDLLKAVAKAESNFTANATSHAGAMGIMQLMPATAKSLGISDAYDPEQNIMGGAKLLASHLDKYHGNVSLALAAYNCGSGAVDKYNGIPPYGETQQYVSKVLAYYNKGVHAPAVANTATSGVSAASHTMTAEERKQAAREAALDRELADIPNLDLHLTSTEDTDISISPVSSSESEESLESGSGSTTNSDSSYEDYLDFADDYIGLLSKLSNSGSTYNTSDDTYGFSPLNNYYSSSIGNNSYSTSILSLLQNALATKKES